MKIPTVRQKMRELFVVEQQGDAGEKKGFPDRLKELKDPKKLKKAARDFWYGKPHEER